MTKKFRVGVVTVLEVEAADWIDATHVAEGALRHAISTARNPHVPEAVTRQPVLSWVGRNQFVYDATVVRAPVELGCALRNGYAHVAVTQPEKEDKCR